jgi:hypothetical protein
LNYGHHPSLRLVFASASVKTGVLERNAKSLMITERCLLQALPQPRFT